MRRLSSKPSKKQEQARAGALTRAYQVIESIALLRTELTDGGTSPVKRADAKIACDRLHQAAEHMLALLAEPPIPAPKSKPDDASVRS